MIDREGDSGRGIGRTFTVDGRTVVSVCSNRRTVGIIFVRGSFIGNIPEPELTVSLPIIEVTTIGSSAGVPKLIVFRMDRVILVIRVMKVKDSKRLVTVQHGSAVALGIGGRGLEVGMAVHSSKGIYRTVVSQLGSISVLSRRVRDHYQAA